MMKMMLGLSAESAIGASKPIAAEIRRSMVVMIGLLHADIVWVEEPYRLPLEICFLGELVESIVWGNIEGYGNNCHTLSPLVLP